MEVCCWTPLMKAAWDGITQEVNRLLAEGDTDVNGQTPLMFAAYNGHCGVARSTRNYHRILLQFGADFNKSDKKKLSALHFSIHCGNLELVGFLLQVGADKVQLTSQMQLQPSFILDLPSHSISLMLAGVW